MFVAASDRSRPGRGRDRARGLLLIAALAACDARATAGGDPGTGVVSADRRSRVHESCAATADCAEPLRCVARTCRAATRSVLGDLFQAAGELALSRGDAAAAVEHFNQALAHLEREELEPPAPLYCAQGRALAALRADKQRGEMAARVLHRCLLGTPAGSPPHQGALHDLALLIDSGLDPAALDREEPADAYLTKAPPRPSADQLELTITGDARQRSRAYAALVTYLGSDAVKLKLMPCWDEHFTATGAHRLELAVPVRLRPRYDGLGDFERGVLTVDAAPAGEAEPAGHGCVREALSALADDYGRSAGEASFSAPVTLSLGPAAP